ncbi:MAG: hypothetical protein LBQ47_08450 [Endomicrobium sp.]|jgi:purine-nucleoside phosphorylase|nr:hypothetical protein [Endomicrobium sp.]
MNFNAFFGISKEQIKKTCILCQNADLPLFSSKSTAGLFVKTADAPKAAAIALKNNFLAGDCVLLLKDSPCKNIILFGSCGARAHIKPGDIIAVEKTYNYESFSHTLFESGLHEYGVFDKDLIELFCKKYRKEKIIKADCACVSSLVLEPELAMRFRNGGPEIFDMESSIVLSGAKKINAKALCLMYACDHIEKNPLGAPFDAKIKQKISSARKKLAELILDFCNEL